MEQINIPPHQQAPQPEQMLPQPIAAAAESAAVNFARRTAHMGNVAVSNAYGSAYEGPVRATARAVEGTLTAPVVAPSEAALLTPGELSDRLLAAGTQAKAANVATELYARPPQTQRESVVATMVASIMERSQPRASFKERARNWLKRR